MGRRSNADLLGIVEQIMDLYNSQKLTINQIVEELQHKGFAVSRSGIQRTVRSYKETARLYKKAMEESKILIDMVRSDPNTDVNEASLSILSRNYFEFVQSMDGLQFKDSAEAAHALKALVQSQTQIAKLRLNFQNGVAAAKKSVMETIRKELQNHPDLLDRLTAVVGGLEVST